MWGFFLEPLLLPFRLCSSNSLKMERNEPTHSEDPNSGTSSSLSSPLVGGYEGGTKKTKGNDYEVFLNFRGKDTRKGFTDYLYTSLVDAGIHVFRDDNELCVGEEIGPELLCSITQSKISIPIISEDYTSSKWCLRELVHILKCKKNKGQIVLPIFYKVEPSKMRHLTGRLRDAINAHKKNVDEMMEWEEALKEVTSLKGLESEKIDNGHEGTLVKTVVRKVMSELKGLFLLNVPKQLVGIDDQVEHIMSKMDAKFSDTSIIGIYGMGGIGKTTLAKVLYNKLRSHYESHSFVPDIRETSKVKGIECIQKQLIFDINGDLCDVSNVDRGINILKSRCTSKKVLILLDDVDDNTHLNALVKDNRWFKAGSTIIITTRDRSILDKAGASYMYELNELPLNQSLILFSRHAFRKDSPPSDYEDISHDVTYGTGGLPLALEIIGSFLCGKKKEAWIDTSKKLKKVPHKKVQERLRISYDALDFEDQQIFLDIACLFTGSFTQNPTYMWDACDFFPGKGIEVLSLMSLIKTEDGKLMMHDQLRDLGREIVRLENLRKPQKRSRLWEYEDAKDVLLNNKGTSKIEALRVDLDYGRESYTAETFKELTNLRFLQLKGANLTGDFQNLRPQLRWLEWTGHHSDLELTNLHLKKLVVLNLSWSTISEGWGGWSLLKMATKLKVLNLSNCALRTTPDLSTLKSLEIFMLKYCKGLEEIHPSIEDIKTLVSLNVNGCQNLKELPLGVGRMKELRELIISNTNVREIPISRGGFTMLETLNASSCRLLTRLPKSLGSLMSLTVLNLSNMGIEELPESIGSLKKLKILNVSQCESLTRIPNSIGDLASLSYLYLIECQQLDQLPDSIGSLMSLSQLLLSGCHSLSQIPDSIEKLTSLTELHLDFMAIEELPESIGCLKKLKVLYASYCEFLTCIPNSIGNLASLSCLDLTECQKLDQLPDSIGSLMSLSQLLLSGCHSLRQIPNSIGKLTSLTELDLNSTAIEELPQSILNMQNLQMLDIGGAPIIELLDDQGILVELEGLRALAWKNQEGPPSNNGQLVFSKNLDLDMCQELSELPSCIQALVLLKHPKTPPANNSAMDYQTANSKHVLKRSRPFGISDEVSNLSINILPVTYNCQSFGQSSCTSNELPRNVVITLSQGSLVKSMDFHPVQQILLLEGTSMGDVMVWEVGNSARIAMRKFKVWDLGTCLMALQAFMANDYIASANRVMWSPNGILFGVTYSKHMVHIHSYHGGDDMRNHLEIEAHVGSVHDLVFSNPNKQLHVVTCGENSTIKVWDAMTGAKQQTFEGHETPVYSICPQHKENIQSIFSMAIDGKIKTWFYDNMRSRVDHDTPGHCSTMMAYSAGGTRLVLCGTNNEEKYLVEWNESERAIKRTYHGLGKRSGGVVQFDTTKNRFLAAGDEFMVKFWDMDNNSLLISADAEGGLPASPCIRFNKEGNLLAVSTSDNNIKILANADGIRLLRKVDNRPFDARITPGPLMKDSESMANVNPRIADESGDKSRIWKLTEINEPLQCRSIRLPDNSMATRVQRLIYTNSGRAILALSSNAVHKLWISQESDQNLTGRATTSVVPQLWRPPCGMLMINGRCRNPEAAVPCFAVSKNNAYLISASGGEISLFNMMAFEKMITFSPPTPPPPPNSDVIAIGMEDPTIQIYSGQVDEIQAKRKVHRRIIKGFAFSTSLHVLMSTGANSQMMTTFMPQPPPATFLAFYPPDNNIIAIGMEDSAIQIYNVRTDMLKANLKGHQKRITGLAFSNALNALVSSGADSQLCVWSTDGWKKQASQFLQMPTGRGAAPLADTRVQFHVDQIHLLVVHETQIATYKAPELECLKQWDTREASAPITDATYSCNGQSIYVSFKDGSIGVLTASTLRLRCRINPAAYIPPSPSLRIYPLVIAAHPFESNQFALGLTDGSVHVLEPLKSEGEWGSSPPVEYGAGPSTTSAQPVQINPKLKKVHLTARSC